MTSAQAAAMAAFKGIKHDDSKKPFKIPTSANITSSRRDLPRIQTKVVSPSPKKYSRPIQTPTTTPSTPQPTTPKQTPTPQEGPKNKSSMRSLTSRSGNRSPVRSYTLKSTKTTETSSSVPRDMVKKVRDSIDAKAIYNDQSQKRLSTSYEPSEMLKNIRSSIKSKFRQNEPAELSQKNQALIDGFRESVERKVYPGQQGPVDYQKKELEYKKEIAPHGFDRYDRSDFGHVEPPNEPTSTRSSFDNHFQNASFEKSFQKSEKPGNSTYSLDDKSEHSYQRPNYTNQSYSSLGSYYSVANALPTATPSPTPAIVVEPDTDKDNTNEHDPDTTVEQEQENVESSSKVTTPTNILPENHLGMKELEANPKDALQLFDSPRTNHERNISPIAVPPSSISTARSPNGTNSSDNLIHTIPSPNTKLSDIRSLVDESSIKSTTLPKRKPPPELFVKTTVDENHSDVSLPSASSQHHQLTSAGPFPNPLEYSFTRHSSASNNDDGYFPDSDFEYLDVDRPRNSVDSERAPQFPQFPSDQTKDHKYRFKRPYKNKSAEQSSPVLPNDSAGTPRQLSDASSLDGSRMELDARPKLGARSATTPIVTHQNQPIQLKTTMRKTNRRKDRKTKFNENKPWKNHNDLNYITEQERKRYEGLWVSNKGNYLNFVVTKLVGIDYTSSTKEDKEDGESVMNEKEALSEQDISLKAARLSSKNETNNNDHDNFHNLNSAKIDDLIHGVVVKRIWSRSRLPQDILKTIWNLVDFRKDGCLNKPEFLVGMWLVDQCLYGRKLPKKVDDAIWDSLGSIAVNVVVKKKRR